MLARQDGRALQNETDAHPGHHHGLDPVFSIDVLQIDLVLPQEIVPVVSEFAVDAVWRAKS
jgi:hypothetical protein